MLGVRPRQVQTHNGRTDGDVHLYPIAISMLIK